MLQEFEGWLWWILAVFLALAELLAPGIYLIWLALAAALVGALNLLIDMSLEWQMTAFALCAIGIVVLARKLFVGANVNRALRSEDARFLNQRNLSYIGREFILQQSIKGGRGKIGIDDGFWLVVCDRDLSAGTRVRVTGADGAVLQIQEAEEKNES